MKMTVFCDCAPLSLVEFDRRFRAISPDDGISKHFCNVGQFLPDYEAQYPRRVIVILVAVRIRNLTFVQVG
jgi:hypothetical protein